MKFPDTLAIPEEVLAIARTLEEAGYEAWCVGGAIRDALLDSLEADVDLATSAPPGEVQRLFPRTVAVGLKYGTVGVLDRRRRLHEVTTFRRDVRTDGRHAEVEFGASLEEDLARRDFTVNAIAYHPLRHEWRDPFGGAEDLGRRRIRAVGEPAARFREDYLRVLRALRFAARLDFVIEDATWAAAVAATPGLAGLSAERVREEWFKGLRTARSLARLVGLWWRVGAAHYWMPELTDRPEPEQSLTRATSRVGAVPRRSQETTIRALDRLTAAERDPIELTVLLCLDPVGVLRRLRASNAEIARAAAMVTGPEEPGGLDDVATRRWLAAVGEAADDLARLWQLRRDQVWPWAPIIDRIRERGDPLTRGDLVVTGADLVAEGVPAGPAVGQLLEQLLDAVLDDPALNTRSALLARVRS